MPDLTRHLLGMEGQWLELGEVWSGQIANARRQIDGAIVALSREFGEIATGLDALARLARELEGDEARLSRAIQGQAGTENRAVVVELESSAARLEQESARIRAGIESALVHLQFQDRVNQILAHVEDSIHALPQTLASARAAFERSGELAPVDFSSLLNALQASYTTAEERTLHGGGTPPVDDELTFF